MDSPLPLLVAACVGLAAFLLALAASSLVASLGGRGGRRVRERITALAASAPDAPASVMVGRQAMSDMPWFDRMLSGLSWAGRFDQTVRQSGAGGTSGAWLLASAVLGVAGLAFGQAVSDNLAVGLGVGLGLGWLPILHVERRRLARLARFEAQLPDALELIARALRAGQTFAGGLRLVADEFPEPIGPEFAKTLDEVNFGGDVDRALNNLLSRVECPDLKFFVVSVNIQRETGGNLSEIVGGIASLVRERFQLMGKVRVLSAEGRLSAMVLAALPFAVALVINLINPGYMSLLVKEPLGRMMAWAAVGSMAVGLVIIRRMVRIRV